MIWKKRKKKHTEIAPDEIFLDAHNLPSFDTHQFEGRMERPIAKRAILAFFALYALALFGFAARGFDLQIVRGAYFADWAENNRLDSLPILAPRGVIADRKGRPLAWNEPADGDIPRRVYADMPGIAHVLGYVSYPKKDSRGFYFQTSFEGKEGVERQYDSLLSGDAGRKITETDVRGEIVSENTIVPPRPGRNIVLSVDAAVQSALYEGIEDLAAETGFRGGAGIIMDIYTGEVIALTSFPEYDPETVSYGKNRAAIRRYVSDPRAPFLNRAVAGLYTPGSTVKPFFGLAALAEGVIDERKEILSTGSISIPNPYFPDKPTVFNDWKAHGWVDLRRALAVSSNVYFYEVGGGYKDQEGLGINRLEFYARMFGLGEKTGVDIPGEEEGVIPTPEWKERNFGGEEWRIGDTYNTAIGQYGFQVTPAELVRAVAAIANGGKKPTPRVFLGIAGEPPLPPPPPEDTVFVEEKHFRAVREGMRMGVTDGIARALDLPFVSVAAKTGTAEVGTVKKFVNSWITGFFPYENPRYAFAVVMERGPHDNLKGAVFVMRSLFEWMRDNAPEYLLP